MTLDVNVLLLLIIFILEFGRLDTTLLGIYRLTFNKEHTKIQFLLINKQTNV